MRAIGNAWCDLYHCEASFFIRDYDNARTLVVRYGDGYAGPWLPLVDGHRQFEAVIPPYRTDDELVALLLTPPVLSKETEHVKNFPTWEAGARWFGSEYLAWPKSAPKLPADPVAN